jgi:hypothetical protein
MTTMEPKDDLGHEESRDFSGLDVVDGAGSDRRLHQFQGRSTTDTPRIPVTGGVFEVVGGQ